MKDNKYIYIYIQITEPVLARRPEQGLAQA